MTDDKFGLNDDVQRNQQAYQIKFKTLHNIFLDISLLYNENKEI